MYKYVRKQTANQAFRFKLILQYLDNQRKTKMTKRLNGEKGYLIFYFIDRKLIAYNIYFHILQIIQTLLFCNITLLLLFYIILKIFIGHCFIFFGDISPKLKTCICWKCSIFFFGYVSIQRV